jgi:hypothetical protein
MDGWIDKQMNRKTDIWMDRERETLRETYRQKDIQTVRHMDRETYGHRDIWSERHMDRETYGQRDIWI